MSEQKSATIVKGSRFMTFIADGANVTIRWFYGYDIERERTVLRAQAIRIYRDRIREGFVLATAENVEAAC